MGQHKNGGISPSTLCLLHCSPVAFLLSGHFLAKSITPPSPNLAISRSYQYSPVLVRCPPHQQGSYCPGGLRPLWIVTYAVAILYNNHGIFVYTSHSKSHSGLVTVSSICLHQEKIKLLRRLKLLGKNVSISVIQCFSSHCISPDTQSSSR